MFQFAFGLSLSKHHYKNVKYHNSNHSSLSLKNAFDISFPVASMSDLSKTHKFLLSTFLSSLLFSKWGAYFRGANIYLQKENKYLYDVYDNNLVNYYSGYWQSERYFDSLREELCNIFLFKSDASYQNRKWRLLIESNNSVSLHVRRGDYLHGKSIHNILHTSYYQMAIDLLNNIIENPVYFIFSDDPEWVHEHFSTLKNYYIIDNNYGINSFRDMELMSLCRHNIIANSSFSWWGAWLNKSNDKIVVAPKKWFKIPINTSDLIPSTWICL